MAVAGDARSVLALLRKGIDVRTIGAHVRKPFRFLLAGDPALISELRALLLRGYEETVPIEAAACLETIHSGVPTVTNQSEVRAIIFLGRRGDLTHAQLEPLRVMRRPILVLTVEPDAPSSGPSLPPAAGDWGEYVVPAITREHLRGRFFPHLIECASGVEVAVGRNLPALRDTVAAKLTRDAANNSLKIALASAVVDHIPLAGVVLGALASAGDMVAITGIQVMLMLHIDAVYGRDPDMQRAWQLLPVIGGGFGWRALARELAGFVPVAGIAIKGAIAYAGTIVVGEGVTFFHEHGRKMTPSQASALYERTKNDALRFSRELLTKLGKRS